MKTANKAFHATPSPYGLGFPRSLRSLGARERRRWAAGEKVKAMRTCAVVITVITALSGTPSFAQSDRALDAPSITPSELNARRQSHTAPLVVDVRTPEEYAVGHIPGALNIAFDQVADRISEVEAPRGVVLYCMMGPRARKGEAALLAVGYTRVYHLEGGLAAWQASGFPVERRK